ncbi:hypothetical protein ACWGI8_25460 [Streptomyces sp. NPDC054841]
MKIRHVRAVAVFGIAIVALTGARGSHGGGCDNSSSHSSSGGSSSSSSSGGSSSSGSTSGDYDGSSSTGSTTGDSSSSSSSGSTTGNSSGGSKAKGRAEDDVKIESCAYNGSGSIVARVSATNNGDERNDYKFQVKFTDPNGTLVRTSNSTIPWVKPGATDTLDVFATYFDGDGTGSKCELLNVTRAPSS